MGQEKELRKMRRAELIEVIYEMEKQLSRTRKENDRLKKRLNDRNIRLKKCGSIAQAALELNGVFEAAQRAADHYVEAVRLKGETNGIQTEQTAGQPAVSGTD